MPRILPRLKCTARWFAGLTLMLGAASSALAQQAASLDGFLAGLERCDERPDFQKLRMSLARCYANFSGAKTAKNDTKVQIAIPAALAGAFGAFTSRLESEYTEVSAPITGVYQGLPLKGITFAFGNENGISLYGVDFAVPRADLVKKYAASLKKAQKQADSESGVSFGIHPKLSRIFCDFSN